MRLAVAMAKASQDQDKVILQINIFGSIFTVGEMNREEVLNYQSNCHPKKDASKIIVFFKCDEKELGYGPKPEDIPLDGIFECNEESNSQTKLHEAVIDGNFNKVKVLLRAGANVDAQDFLKMTPLCYAAKNGHRDIVKFLLDNGANINVTGPLDKNPFYCAVEGGCVEIIMDLLKKDKYGFTATDDLAGETPLHLAAKKKNSTEILEVLLKAKKLMLM